jgi:hypothetical protein
MTDLNGEFAVIYCATVGAGIERSVFEGNSVEFSMSGTRNTKMIVAQCYFSGPFPPGDIYASTSAIITSGRGTASLNLAHLDTMPCRGNPPSRSSDPTPTAAVTPLPSPTQAATNPFTNPGSLGRRRNRKIFSSFGLLFIKLVQEPFPK